MRVRETDVPGVLLIEPKIFQDARGFFLETYNRARYAEAGIGCDLVQDNHSRSVKGTLRGLHFQTRRPQSKLVWVIQGEIFDVAVDIRPGSSTFGRWTAARLSSENRAQLFVPAGLAHGFCVLSETAEVIYKCGDYYDPGGEGGIIWNDPDLAIDWPISAPILSAKDAKLPPLAAITNP